MSLPARSDSLQHLFDGLQLSSTVAGCILEMRLLAARQHMIAERLDLLLGKDTTQDGYSSGSAPESINDTPTSALNRI